MAKRKWDSQGIECMDHMLVADGAAHLGQYVTLSSVNSSAIISAASSAVEAMKQAEAKGFPEALLIYVPLEDEHNNLL